MVHLYVEIRTRAERPMQTGAHCKFTINILTSTASVVATEPSSPFHSTSNFAPVRLCSLLIITNVRLHIFAETYKALPLSFS